MKSVAVFLSASSKLAPIFFSEAEMLGESLAEGNYRLVYGGANCGLMGALAKGHLNKKGQVVGVIPEKDYFLQVVQEGMTEKHVVTSLSERKAMMIDLADAFVVFPGGLGTLDEALDILVMKQTEFLSKPIVFLNTLDFWTPQLQVLDEMAQMGFIHGRLDDLYTVVDTVPKLMKWLKSELHEE